MTVKVGVIGVGGIAQRFHIPSLKSIGAEITFLAGRHADEVAKKHGCKGYLNYEEALKETETDAVLVCLPNYLHYEASKAALEAGKHVFCEKPMTTTMQDAEDLVETVRRTKRIFQVGYMKRFNPAVIDACTYIKKIGKIQTAIIRSYFPVGNEIWKHNVKKAWSLQKSLAGGGALVHSGSHVIDLMLFILRGTVGDPVRVFSKSRCHANWDIDYITSSFLEFERGETVFMENYWHPLSRIGFRQDGWDEKAEIYGDKGYILLLTPFWHNVNDQPQLRVYLEEEGVMKEVYSEQKNYFLEEIRAFVKSVEQGTQIKPDVVDGYRVQEIIDKLYLSSVTCRPVEVKYKY